MADLTQTRANVAMGSQNTPTRLVQYGESVLQGQPLYRDELSGKYFRCDANDGAAKAVVEAIALTPGAADAYGLVALPSSVPGRSLINLGATLVVGTHYAVSATVGAIAPIADITSTQFPAIIGPAVSTSLLDFQPSISTVAKA
jgi:hypothetical protein